VVAMSINKLYKNQFLHIYIHTHNVTNHTSLRKEHEGIKIILLKSCTDILIYTTNH